MKAASFQVKQLRKSALSPQCSEHRFWHVQLAQHAVAITENDPPLHDPPAPQRRLLHLLLPVLGYGWRTGIPANVVTLIHGSHTGCCCSCSSSGCRSVLPAATGSAGRCCEWLWRTGQANVMK